jgi:hypothetical protein
MGEPRAILAELRRLRRIRRTAHIDRFEAFYRVYLAALFLSILTFVGSARLPDFAAGREVVTLVTERGAAMMGLLVAAACAGGMRSGADGGPLVIEPAEVQLVLAAPVARAYALRSPALRKLRFGCYVGLIAGAAAGVLAYRRFPAGGLFEWVASLVLFGALLTVTWNALALIFSGNGWGRRAASAAGFAVIAVSLVDVLMHTRLAPSTLVGAVSIWPLDQNPSSIVGIGLIVAAAAVGIRVVGGTSIENARRRSGLVSGLRFSASIGDVRAIVLTRRKLAHEAARAIPMIRLRPSTRSQFAVWKRDWHGVLRWNSTRFLRVLVLSATTGVVLKLVWRDVTPMIAVGGGLLYLAGLDAIDPMGQETDHATITESLPLQREKLLIKHLPAAIVVMVGVSSVAMVVARILGVDISPSTALATALTSAAGAAIGAAVSTAAEPPILKALQTFTPPEVMGLRVVSAMAIPPGLATLGLLPFLAERVAPGAAAQAAGFVTLALSLVVLAARNVKPILARTDRVERGG